MHVLTYRDQGRVGIGDNCPSAFAILFDDEKSAYAYWEAHKHLAGYKAEVRILEVTRNETCRNK